MGSRFGAFTEEQYDKIAPVIACTLPALTDSILKRKSTRRITKISIFSIRRL